MPRLHSSGNNVVERLTHTAALASLGRDGDANLTTPLLDASTYDRVIVDLSVYYDPHRQKCQVLFIDSTGAVKLAYPFFSQSQHWQHIEMSFTPEEIGDSKFQFVMNSDDSILDSSQIYGCCIDDVNITAVRLLQVPTCPEIVDNLQFWPLPATLQWKESIEAVFARDDLSYIVEAGSAPDQLEFISENRFRFTNQRYLPPNAELGKEYYFRITPQIKENRPDCPIHSFRFEDGHQISRFPYREDFEESTGGWFTFSSPECMAWLLFTFC